MSKALRLVIATMFVVTTILVITTDGVVMAQPAPRPPAMINQYWWENPVARNSLNLSEAQTKQMSAIVQASVGRLKDLRTAVNNAEANLDDIFNQPEVDDLKADAAIDQYANARENLTRMLSQVSLKMRQVLTHEQWQDLVNRQNGRGGARGGPGRNRRVPPGSAPGSTSNKVSPAPPANQK